MAEQMYRWRGESFTSGSHPIGEADGLAAWGVCVDLLRGQLHDMAGVYPKSRDGIVGVQRSLNHALTGDWIGSFQVLEFLPHDVTVKLSIRKEDAMTRKSEPGPAYHPQEPLPVSPPPPPAPRLRAGNAERRRYQEHLTSMFADGRLSKDEFEALYERVAAVVYDDELPPLIAELPPLPPQEPGQTEPEESIVPGMRHMDQLVAIRQSQSRRRQGLLLVPLGLTALLFGMSQGLPNAAAAPMQAIGYVFLLVAIAVGLLNMTRR